MTRFGEVAEESVEPYNIIESEKLLKFMKSRRTVRFFKDQKVGEEDILKILEAGRYCPTGTNAQDFTFTVITEKLSFFENDFFCCIMRKHQMNCA